MSTVSLPAIVAITLLFPTLSVALSSCDAGENVKERCDAGENEKCDLYKGSWVLDESYPLYPWNCQFIALQFNCTGNGRPDQQYLKYRWQPNNCDLPKWDGVEFVERMRGKTIMLVGDSLSMNQWQSLACMILAAHPNTSFKTPTATGLFSNVVFTELNVTLMYLRNTFITDVIINNGTIVLNLDSLAVNSRQWLQSDVLIFDTWHWWLHTGKKKPWDLVQDGNVTVSDMDRFEAYEKALRTWARWVDQNVDLAKIKIFFQGVSPDHWNASTWGMSEMQRCGGEQEPLKQPIEESTSTTRAGIILKEVLMSMNKKIHLLDITELSRYRVDAHPSIYGSHKHRGMDCSHWCLPGVPDTWNQILYAILMTLDN